MIHYFIKEEKAETGPFTMEQLKKKSLSEATPIWFAGLPEWTTAGEVHALREIFLEKDCERKFSIKALGNFFNSLFKKTEPRKGYQLLLSKQRNNFKEKV